MDNDPFSERTPEVVDTTPPGALSTTATHLKPRLGLSVPGAIGGVLLIGAIAFGASLTGSPVDRPADPTAKPAAMVTDPDPTSKPSTEADAPKSTAASDPTAKPTEEPEATKAPEATDEPESTKQPEPTEKPTAKPTQKAEPKPTPKPTEQPAEKPVLEIALANKEGGVKIAFSACEVDGAEAYKIVRSTDGTVRWPAGEGDTLAAVVGMDGELRAWDGDAPDGKKVWYRVFCVRHTDTGYKVLAASPATSIETAEAEPEPTPKPTPETVAMWLEVGVDGDAVVLHWEACGSDGFSHYRIVRKVDGEGSVIAEIEDAATTAYIDADVEAGATYHYVVQAKGRVGDDWVLLGTTDWASVAVE